jgi:WD40 repeat protein
VTLSADGSLLALTEVDKIAALMWDVEENSKLKELTGFQTAAPVYSLRFGPGGRSLIWISRARVQLMDIATGTLSKPFEHEDFVGGLALSSDGKTLITGAGPKINLWDVASGQARSGLAENGPVMDMALAPDNRLLAVATPQGCRLWDITTGKQTGFMPGVARLVAFSDDGRQLAVADDQGNIVLWRSGP